MNKGGIPGAMIVAVASIIGPWAAPPPPLLVWNATASAPVGLYAVAPVAPLQVGEWVFLRPPASAAGLFAARGYLARGVPLLKPVAAVGGQTVCRRANVVTVDGVEVAHALSHDHLGRPLPVWRGCVRLGAADVLVLNRAIPASLDGRYFGPVPRGAIFGRAVPLWLRKADPEQQIFDGKIKGRRRPGGVGAESAGRTKSCAGVTDSEPASPSPKAQCLQGGGRRR